MREAIEKIVHSNTLILYKEGQLQDRCGLCCALPPTKTFSKEGTVCRNLQADGGMTYSCRIHGQHSSECSNFECNRLDMNKRLEWFILDALSGQRKVPHYVESSDYREDEDVVKALQSMRKIGLLNHSFIYQGLQHDTVLNDRTRPALWAILQALDLTTLQNVPLREVLGIDNFFRKLSRSEVEELPHFNSIARLL